MGIGQGPSHSHSRPAYILEQAVRDIWVDVLIVSAPPEAMASQTIRQAEQEKRKAYGCAPFTTQNSYDGVRPFVIEQYGHLAEAVRGQLMHLVANKAHAKTLAGQTPTAQPQRNHEKFGEILWTLVRCTWAALKEWCGGAINAPSMSLPG